METSAAPQVPAAAPWRQRLRAFTFTHRWSIPRHYGRRRAILSLLGHSVTWRTVMRWDSGALCMPLWAREIIAGYLEDRARRDLETAAKVRALPLPQRPKLDSATAREIGARGAAARKASYAAGLRWKNKKGARRKRAPDSSETR